MGAVGAGEGAVGAGEGAGGAGGGAAGAGEWAVGEQRGQWGQGCSPHLICWGPAQQQQLTGQQLVSGHTRGGRHLAHGVACMRHVAMCPCLCL